MTCVNGSQFHDGTADDFGCKLRNISFAPSAMPNRNPHAAATVAKDKRWDRDIPAYQRLRKNGMQPPAIDGSAALETKARTTTEITTGRVVGDAKFAKRLDRAMHEVPT